MTDYSPSAAPLQPQQSTPMRLPYAEPWSWRQFHSHFALRALPGVERLTPHSYSRSFRLGSGSGWLRVRPLADEAALELHLS
ncbi:MAG: AlkA N-terminal domain-containing protein, partial [Pseudomonas sp.]